MFQKEDHDDAIILLARYKIFFQCFMILIGSNGGNAQHISSTTHFILCCSFQMCIWKRKDGIKNHKFIFNSYDALMIINFSPF